MLFCGHQSSKVLKTPEDFKMNDDLKNAYHRLTGLKNQAEGAQASMKNFRSEAGSFLTDKALKHFSELNEIISECTRTLSENLNKLNYKVKTRGAG
jgi:hypothetical protein